MGNRGLLTDDEQSVPLPLPGFTRAGNGRVDLRVGILHITHNILGTMVNLLHLGFLDVHDFGNFLVQTTELDHILFNLPNSGRSFQGGATGIVGLTGSRTGDL